MSIHKYLDPKNDVAFKRIFGSEKNKDILIALLNSVLTTQIHQPIQKVSFLPPEQRADTLAKKTSIVDVLCQDEDGCTYIVEMQVAEKDEFKARAQYYACRAFVEPAERGTKYKDLKKVIFLAFTDYDIFPQKKSHKSDHQVLDVVTHEQDLDKLHFTFVDLKKFRKLNSKPLEKLTLEEKFYYFLSHQHNNSDALEALTTEAPIKKALSELNAAYWSPDELRQYEAEEKRAWDYRSGLDFAKEEGLKKGREEERRGLVQGMHKAGGSLDFIQQSTGLSLETIKAMISSKN